MASKFPQIHIQTNIQVMTEKLFQDHILGPPATQRVWWAVHIELFNLVLLNVDLDTSTRVHFLM